MGPELLQAAKASFGDDFKMHILVHNAGVSTNAKLGEISMEAYKRQMAINVQGPLFISQEFLPYIPKHAGGRIIMLSSVSARQGAVRWSPSIPLNAPDSPLFIHSHIRPSTQLPRQQ